ncbi:hypothetical protein IFM89_035192 [Coptis chinensis]|uniref:Pentatricopeptide repeat-containing protein n=1 Tax=Coptis chinensis TaxID=261450 RepID=A0A835IKD5_9MAGN|nr:hypothetical protein IFM89_035192 [Coptis chinensis]
MFKSLFISVVKRSCIICCSTSFRNIGSFITTPVSSTRVFSSNAHLELLISSYYRMPFVPNLIISSKSDSFQHLKTAPYCSSTSFCLETSTEENCVGLDKVYETIMDNCKRMGLLIWVRNPTRGMQVLEEMIKLGHTPDNFTYTTAIDTFCNAGMVSEAVALFEFMRTRGSTMSSPTAKTYAIMIVALAQCDRMEECFKLIADMSSSGCLPDVSTYKELIEGLCLAGKIEEAYKFLEDMGSKGYPADIVTYNCFLKVLCDLKKADEALKLYLRIIEVGCVPSVHTFNMLITMYFEVGQPDGAFETWDEMERRGCARDIETYCVMIEGLFACNNVKDACFLLQDVANKGMQLPYRKFDSFLMKLSAVGDLQAIHRLSEHMRSFYNTAMARRFALTQKHRSMSIRRN